MIKQGHVLDVLAGLPDNHFHTVVTSPPYWSLRKYNIPDVVWADGWTGQLGLEPTIDLYLSHLLSVFREVRRVLRPDGTCWVNMGDSYAGSGKASGRTWENGIIPAMSKKQGTNKGSLIEGMEIPPGLKAKDLCLIPFRFALAMQADGWWVRSDIIWAKRNPMPESVTDRPTRAHEYIFLFTKSARYFYDQEAVKEKSSPLTTCPKKPSEGHKTMLNKNQAEVCGDGWADAKIPYRPPTRNLRSVWDINSQAYPEAHFATFPEELPRRCILAGTSARGCCPECGKPWVRVIDHKANYTKREKAHAPMSEPSKVDSSGWKPPTITDNGWKPTCECGGEPVPCRVLDPFIGSGTTGKVAESLGREWVGIDLGYGELSDKRTITTMGLAL